jgi:hypothetical protein
MGRRRIAIAGFLVEQILVSGTPATMVVGAIHSPKLVDARWAPLSSNPDAPFGVELLVESPSFEGGDEKSFDQVDPHLVMFERLQDDL